MFNAAFVYLLEPGQMPDLDLLRLHSEYRDKVLEHWFHFIGVTITDHDGLYQSLYLNPTSEWTPLQQANRDRRPCSRIHAQVDALIDE